MLGRIVIAAVLVIVALAAVKNGWVLRRSGLLGSCKVYATTSTGSQWELCSSGTIDGRPDLSGSGCSAGSTSGKLQYWYCPTSIASSPGGGV
jgi:hypothetical protein